MDRITSAILLLIAALVVHLAEETKTGFRKKLPIGEMPRLLFIGINVVVYAFCFTTLLLSARGHELAIPFAWVFAIAMLMNDSTEKTQIDKAFWVGASPWAGKYVRTHEF